MLKSNSQDASDRETSQSIETNCLKSVVARQWDLISEIADTSKEAITKMASAELRRTHVRNVPYSQETVDTVAARVREIMKSKGINQTKLAAEVGISTGSISKILSSPERSKVVTLARIAKALNVDLSLFFLSGSINENPENPTVERAAMPKSLVN